ncbi:MAG: hypothetical protein CMF69_04570 [Magnetovibrio sp.]|nr:hypothetical protein [Magnetovibrio sp.]|tara:strand:+ start:532 stop:1332 length:801 start_codon:yes stop_codon:yes gene_type:complete
MAHHDKKFHRHSPPDNYSSQKICHFSFHKNLTVYYARVAREFSHKTGRTQHHFNSFKEKFLKAHDFDIRSVNNQYIDIEVLFKKQKNLTFSLFMRDPRDLVVSGYHYHKRGAEPWCNVKNPTFDTLQTVNMHLPRQFLQKNETICECLTRLDLETGLQMEVEMRVPHYETLRAWINHQDNRGMLLTIKYDDVIKDSAACFEKLAHHYGFSNKDRLIWLGLAEKYSYNNVSTKHVRDPSPGQWRKTLSQSHIDYFEDNYPDVISYFE